MGLFDFLRSLRDSSPSAVRAQLAAKEARIRPLSEAEARAAALRLLESGGLEAERDPVPNAGAPLAGAPDAVRELFAAYRSVGVGGTELFRDEIAPWTRAAGYVRIGSAIEHADVVVRAADGRVFLCEDDGAEPPDLDEEHPSIWHLLLMHAPSSATAGHGSVEGAEHQGGYRPPESV